MNPNTFNELYESDLLKGPQLGLGNEFINPDDYNAAASGFTPDSASAASAIGMSPGFQSPRSPGFQSPRSPGFQSPGSPRSPGFQSPGFQSPGFQSPGFQSPNPYSCPHGFRLGSCSKCKQAQVASLTFSPQDLSRELPPVEDNLSKTNVLGEEEMGGGGRRKYRKSSKKSKRKSSKKLKRKSSRKARKSLKR